MKGQLLILILGQPIVDRVTIERILNNPNVSHVRIVLGALHHALHKLCGGDIAKLTRRIVKLLEKPNFDPPLRLLATNVTRILSENRHG